MGYEWAGEGITYAFTFSDERTSLRLVKHGGGDVFEDALPQRTGEGRIAHVIVVVLASTLAAPAPEARTELEAGEAEEEECVGGEEGRKRGGDDGVDGLDVAVI